jgi:hypothetical protein
MNDNLPPLPPHTKVTAFGAMWTADQMRAYAAAAVATERERFFELGWRTAANWMERDDLIADIGSPAYLKDFAAAIRGEQK